MSDETTPVNAEAPVEPTQTDETPVEPAPEVPVAPTPICFIGADAVISAEKQGDFTTVEFANGTKETLHNLLFDKMITPEANDPGGSYNDLLCATIAKEIIALFTVYRLRLGEADLALNYAANNATNLKRSGDKKLWNGKRPEEVTLEDIRNVLA